MEANAQAEQTQTAQPEAATADYLVILVRKVFKIAPLQDKDSTVESRLAYVRDQLHGDFEILGAHVANTGAGLAATLRHLAHMVIDHGAATVVRMHCLPDPQLLAELFPPPPDVRGNDQPRLIRIDGNEGVEFEDLRPEGP